MIKSLFAVGLVAAVGVFLCPSIVRSNAFANDDARKAIQAAYFSSDRAASKMDVDGMLAHCAPDFVLYHENGRQQTLADTREYVHDLSETFHTLSNRTRIISVSPQGPGLVVLVSEHQVITTTTDTVSGNSFPSSTDKIKWVQVISTCTSDNLCRDYWVTVGNGWLEKRTRVLSSKRHYRGSGFSMTGAFHW